MEAALTPREIQARIRAGATVEELSKTSGMPTADIEPFASPVVAERAFIAGQATRGQVRRNGPPTQQTLVELVSDRLTSRGVDITDVNWDAWRGADRLWTLRASYLCGSSPHEAMFRYDSTGRFSVAINDEARWLIGEETTAKEPQSRRHHTDVDSEPTADLPRRTHRPVIDFEPDDYSPAQLAEVDGIYDLVPNEPMDVLYDMLAGFNEDSVRIYEGLTGVVHTPAAEGQEDTVRTSSRRPKATSPVIDLAKGDEAKEPTQRIPKSKKRATVPTWDEIMFGSPQSP